MKKRCIAALLACVMVFTLIPITSSAATVDESQQYLFSLTAGVGEGAEPTDKLYVIPGDILTVYFTLTRTDIADGSYPVFAVQEEVEFSDSLFDIEEAAVFNAANPVAFTYNDLATIVQGNKRIQMYYASTTLEGELFPRELFVGSFKLRVKDGASGTTQITSQKCEMSNQNGLKTYLCTAKDINVIFGDDPSNPRTYKINILNPLGGTINASPSDRATAGTAVSLTAVPQQGYHFGEWKVIAGSDVVPVTNKSSASGAGFVMPKSDVSVTATFEKDSPNPGGGDIQPGGGTTKPRFIDVTETHWAYEYVEYMAAGGFVNGKTPNMFYPEDPITRAEFIAILARMSGEQKSEGYSGPFTDVDTNQYYASAVAWAARAGVTKGTSDTTFSPHQKITRQEIAAMIVRYAKYMHYTITLKNEARDFSDSASIAEYARPSVSEMQQADIINGYQDGTFRPLRNATRAEAVKMLALTYMPQK